MLLTAGSFTHEISQQRLGCPVRHQPVGCTSQNDPFQVIPMEAWAVCTRVSLLSGLCKINITTSAGARPAPWQVEQCGISWGISVYHGISYPKIVHDIPLDSHVFENSDAFVLTFRRRVVDLLWTTPKTDQMTGRVSTKKK